MGGVKKVVKKVGGLFGIGGGNSAPAAPSIETAPQQLAVQNQDVSLANDGLTNTAREKKRTKLNVAADQGDTILGGAGRPTTGA